MAFALDSCPQILLFQLACAKLGVPCTGLSPLGSVGSPSPTQARSPLHAMSHSSLDEIWHEVDLCEASHVFTEPKYLSKFEVCGKPFLTLNLTYYDPCVLRR